MKIALNIILFIPLIGLAQKSALISNTEKHGIYFEQKLSWKEILEKAKAENKYIFVDCFATWCVPCKYMDKNVYPQDSVGNYMNTKFISIKVQLDTDRLDNEGIKNWYSTAHVLKQNFHLESVPAYLFFLPDGSPIHKDVGEKNVEQFISLAQDAIHPQKQYYTLLKAYHNGMKDYESLPALISFARAIGEIDDATMMFEDYIKNHLLALHEDELYTKANVQFILSFPELLNSRSIVFNILFNHSDKVDKAIGFNGLSQGTVDRIITKEQISDEIDHAKNRETVPQWRKIAMAINDKYGVKYSERNILSARIDWYKYKSKWKKYVKCIIEQVSKFSRNDFIYFNNSAYEVFKYSNKKSELKKALEWIGYSIQIGGDSVAFVMDTKANLLFKLGREKEGITMEQKAAEWNKGDSEIQNNLAKMIKDYKSRM